MGGVSAFSLRYDPSQVAVDLAPPAGEDDVESEATLAILSDARVDPSEVPPGTPLRGYWADTLDPTGQQVGSRLWLLEQAEATPANAKRAEQYIREALKYLLDQKRLRAITTYSEIVDDRIQVGVELVKRNGQSIPLGPFEVTRAA